MGYAAIYSYIIELTRLSLKEAVETVLTDTYIRLNTILLASK
jgi:hypothetical protein